MVNQSHSRIMGKTIVESVSIEQDIDSTETEHDLHQAYKQLKKIIKELEEQITQKKEELSLTNKKLENEIIERKRAEKKNTAIKETLENIINNTSEIIVTLDNLNRIEYWNTTAERIIGYKKREVIGKYIKKISCFEKPEILIDLIKKANDSQKTVSEQITINTKDYSKKIINLFCSPVYQKGITSGVICIGRDLTYDWKTYRNLIPGHSYLITDNNETFIANLFKNTITNNTAGLYFSRSPYTFFDNHTPSQQLQYFIIGSKEKIKTPTVSTLKELQEQIETFISTEAKGIIVINDIHYFITKFSFTDFINTCYELNDLISQSKSILFLSLNKLMVIENQFAILESEFKPLWEKNIDEIRIKDELFEIIQFIYEENSKNALVSFTKLMTKFNIVYYTASKRIELLFKEGLVSTKKYGRTRFIHLTEKGKSLLQKRSNI